MTQKEIEAEIEALLSKEGWSKKDAERYYELMSLL